MRPVAIFFAVFLPLTGLMEALMIVSAFNGNAVTCVMWSVGVAALVTVKLTGESFSVLGWRFGALRFHAIAYGLPIVYGVLAYGAAAALGLAGFGAPDVQQKLAASMGLAAAPLWMGVLGAVLLQMTAGVVSSASNTLGEEIGWRGFLVPKLFERWGFVSAALCTGVIWAAWHMPAIFLSNYNAGGVPWAEAASFTVLVVAISGPMAWLRISSGSLWPAALLHAGHNLFIQGIFDPLSTRGTSPYTMVGEFGVVLAVTSALVCAPFWVWGARMQRMTNASQ